MRFAALVPAYPPRSRVGAWVATHGFLRHLVTRGHHVDVLTTMAYGPVETLDGIGIGPGNASLIVDAAVALADVVVSHAGDTGRPAAIAAKWGKPNVRMAHGHIDNLPGLAGAALVVFNSHSLAATVDCPAPWIVCHPPVDPVVYRTSPGDRVTLVNLSEAKGGVLFWRLARALPHVGFLGVLGGYGRQVQDDLPNVEVIPTTTDMREVYARTRVLLMPSERETWGMVGVEAMCSGIPVIAHPTQGLVESLGDAAMFVDRTDGQKWVDTINLLDVPAVWRLWSARALGRAARYDPQADLDRFADAVEALAGVPV